jgi:DNA-binding response OmpR family regulator
MAVLRQEPKKILLVGSDACTEVEEQLARADLRVAKTNGGAAAVECAKYNSFSAAVLMSTGREMDLAETALNLRDMQPSLEIIILVDRTLDAELEAQADAVLRAIPKSRILTIPELNNYLAFSKRMRNPGEF